MFLPENYREIPASIGDYMRMEDGANNIRILSSAIVGYEYWNTENKPVRNRTPWETLPGDIRIEKNGSISKIKHFWAFVVWNYEKSKIQILQVTQKTIMEGIKSLIDNPKWGDPKTFDITITKMGEGLETSYSVMPNPHSAVEDTVTAEFRKKTVNLEALYEGKDPFVNTATPAEIVAKASGGKFSPQKPLSTEDDRKMEETRY